MCFSDSILFSGYDWNNGVDYNALLETYRFCGFQATNFGLAVDEILRMVSFSLVVIFHFNARCIFWCRLYGTNFLPSAFEADVIAMSYQNKQTSPIAHWVNGVSKGTNKVWSCNPTNGEGLGRLKQTIVTIGHKQTISSSLFHLH